ncbi:MAG: amidohydrolase [Bacillota bacterium]
MARLLIRPAAIVTMEAREKIIENGEIAVKDSLIIHVGPRGALPADFVPDKIIDAHRQVALPGFVNCHTHAAMTLLRGYADDLPLMQWLEEKIWPVEANLQREDIYWGTMLCCLEMIRSGTTTFADMYFAMDRVAGAVEKSGLRASLCRGMIGVGPNGEQALEESREFVEQWHGGAGGRVTAMFGPHAPYTCPPEYLKRVMNLAGQLNVGIHIHLAETGTEVENIKKQYGTTPIQLMENTGLFEYPVLAAHCVHLAEEDMAILARRGVGIAHNPESNMKLASGIAPVARLLELGAKVGLGTDGAASNNNLDMVEEMRTAALLQKVATGDPMVLPAFEALWMATAGGAAALGLGEQIGMLKPGMKADLVLLDLHQPHLYPRHDLLAHLVYASKSSDVKTVIVDGELVMEDGQVLTMDTGEIYDEVQRRADRLVGRSSS